MLGLTINVETARGEVYTWVNQTLRQQGYEGLNRSGRGLERQYMEKMTGRHRARTTWLITMHLSGEEVKTPALPASALHADLWAGGHRLACGDR